MPKLMQLRCVAMEAIFLPSFLLVLAEVCTCGFSQYTKYPNFNMKIPFSEIEKFSDI